MVINKERYETAQGQIRKLRNGAGTACDRGDTHGDRGSTRHQLEEDTERADEGEDQIQYDSDAVGGRRPANRGLDRPQEWKSEYTGLYLLSLTSSSHHDLFFNKSCFHFVLHLPAC